VPQLYLMETLSITVAWYEAHTLLDETFIEAVSNLYSFWNATDAPTLSVPFLRLDDDVNVQKGRVTIKVPKYPSDPQNFYLYILDYATQTLKAKHIQDKYVTQVYQTAQYVVVIQLNNWAVFSPKATLTFNDACKNGSTVKFTEGVSKALSFLQTKLLEYSVAGALNVDVQVPSSAPVTGYTAESIQYISNVKVKYNQTTFGFQYAIPFPKNFKHINASSVFVKPITPISDSENTYNFVSPNDAAFQTLKPLQQELVIKQAFIQNVLHIWMSIYSTLFKEHITESTKRKEKLQLLLKNLNTKNNQVFRSIQGKKDADQTTAAITRVLLHNFGLCTASKSGFFKHHATEGNVRLPDALGGRLVHLKRPSTALHALA